MSEPTQTTESILSTFAFSFFIGGITYIVFEACRGITAIYCKRVVSFTHRTLPKAPRHVFGWIAPILRVTKEETLRMVGLDGYVLLRFIYMCWRFSIFCTICGMVVLLPVYVTGHGYIVTNEDEEKMEDFYKLTIANIKKESMRLWAPTVLAYVYSGYFIHLLHQEYKQFFVLRQQFLAKGDEDIPKQVSYTVMVENIPQEYRDPVTFRVFFERLFPGQVYCTALCLDLRKLNSLTAARTTCRDSLEKAIAYKHATGEEPKIVTAQYSTCTRTEQDAIPFHANRLRELNEEVVQMQEQYAQQLPAIDDYDSHAARTIGFLVSGVSGAVAGVQNRFKRPKDDNVDSGGDVVEHDTSPRDSDEGSQNSGKLNQARRLIGAVGNTAAGITGQITKEALYGVKTITSTALHGVTEAGRQLEMLTLGANYSIASTGFVTFRTHVTAAASYQMLLTSRTLRMELRPAYPPRDIIWENVAIPVQQLKSRRYVTSGWVIAGGLFWSLIVASIQALVSVDSLSKVIPDLENYEETSYLIGYLPVITLILVMQLLPLIFYYLALYYEGLKTHSELDQYVMARYFYFQLVNIYVTVMVGSVWRSLKQILEEDFQSVLNEVADAVPKVAVYFINLVLVQLLITLPLVLLRIFPLYQLALVRLFNDRKKMTRRELRSGPFSDPVIYYGWEYPNMLMVLMIILTYTVITPLVCPFGILYFGAAYIVYKYQLVYTYVPSRESGGKHFYSLFNRAMVALVASIVTLFGYMILKEGVTQAACLLPLPFIIFYFWRKIDKEHFAASRHLSLEQAVEMDDKQEIAVDTNESDIASFDPRMFVQPTLIEPLQEPEPYRAEHQDSQLPLSAEDIELSPPAMRESLAEYQESYTRSSLRLDAISQLENGQDEKV